MRTVIETFLICDGKAGRCGNSFGVYNRSRNRKEQRAAAKKKDGWACIGYRDYCDECVKESKNNK